MKPTERTQNQVSNDRPSAAPAERELIGLGIPPSVVAISVECLNRALANLYILLVKTKKCHWDVVGPQFMSLHTLLDEQYRILDEFADKSAERVRMLGAFPVGSVAGFLELTDLKEHPIDVPTATEVVVALLRDHEIIARMLRDATKRVEGDIGTADFFTQMLREHENIAWRLRSFVHGDAVHSVSSAQVRTRSGHAS